MSDSSTPRPHDYRLSARSLVRATVRIAADTALDRAPPRAAVAIAISVRAARPWTTVCNHCRGHRLSTRHSRPRVIAQINSFEIITSFARIPGPAVSPRAACDSRARLDRSANHTAGDIRRALASCADGYGQAFGHGSVAGFLTSAKPARGGMYSRFCGTSHNLGQARVRSRDWRLTEDTDHERFGNVEHS